MTVTGLRLPLVLGLLLATLAACAGVTRLDAAGDVHALLIAIRDDDPAAFDAHVDRRALAAEFQAGIMRRAAGAGLAPAAALLSGPLARGVGAIVIQPEVFRAAAYACGYRPDQPIPDRLAIAASLRALPDGRVCARSGSGRPCLLTFAREGDTWRLVGFDEAALGRVARR